MRTATLNGFKYGDGSGIDVALIDTGVAPVAGLGADNVLHGPDLSGEGASEQVAYLDTFGHGTHMAGIIAGNRSGHNGVAPGARIVSIKVAGADGITTIPQVVAAIDWVIEYGNQDGLNIRVLNLSLGQSGVETHVGDDLSIAVERAWDAGIFVVVAAGNRGDIYSHLDSPAIDPYVMAVGAVDTLSAKERSLMDVPNWSATGDGTRNPDAVAPGKSVASYRVPGSTADAKFPNARLDGELFLGSGSSQAAAAVSGAAAALLSARPDLDNNALKAGFMKGASSLEEEKATKAGYGLVDAKNASRIRNGHEQTHTSAQDVLVVSTDVIRTTTVLSTDTTLESTTLLRSTAIVADDTVLEVATPKPHTNWSGGTWSGGTWSGATWSGATWSGGTWSGATWSGATWSGATWSGATWSGGTWSGATWSGATWSGATWSGATWSGKGWITK